ncbi:LOW QUALITY PROTEIN: rho GTPase-activating protein 20-like [Menidia menidia]
MDDMSPQQQQQDGLSKGGGQPDHKRRMRFQSYRRQSAPSLVITKALTRSKTLSRESFLVPVCPESCPLVQSLLSGSGRVFLLHGHAQLKTGMQTQDRHLFLFSDILVVAKAKSANHFKQKAQVRVCEMWTAGCLDEVCEGSTPPERGFVMGWPTWNCVAVFSSSEQKERWLSLLKSRIREEKESEEPKTIPLRVYGKGINSFAVTKTLPVSNSDCTNEVIRLALQQFGIIGGVREFQLWVISRRDNTPYPLMGHEFPFSIQMSHARGWEGGAPAGERPLASRQVQFVLKPRPAESMQPLPPADFSQKSFKRRRSLISWAFWRGSAPHLAGGGGPRGRPRLPVRPAARRCVCGGALPKPVMDMLVFLYHEGCWTRGIFRRPAGARAVRELRDALDAGEAALPLTRDHVFLIAGVFKDFLRSLPGSLLGCELYQEWMDVLEEEEEEQERVAELQRMVGRLFVGLFVGFVSVCGSVFGSVCCWLLVCWRVVSLVVCLFVCLVVCLFVSLCVCPPPPLQGGGPAVCRSVCGFCDGWWAGWGGGAALLLRHLLALLYSIQAHAHHNQMTSFNLAVCIAPSLLWPPGAPCSPEVEGQGTKKVCELVKFMMEHSQQITGEDPSVLFGGRPQRRDSEETGSAESWSYPLTDSSYDSLENELDSPPPGLSGGRRPTRGSLDSILTFSDGDQDAEAGRRLAGGEGAELSSPMAALRLGANAARRRSEPAVRFCPSASGSTDGLTGEEEDGEEEEEEAPPLLRPRPRSQRGGASGASSSSLSSTPASPDSLDSPGRGRGKPQAPPPPGGHAPGGHAPSWGGLRGCMGLHPNSWLRKDRRLSLTQQDGVEDEDRPRATPPAPRRGSRDAGRHKRRPDAAAPASPPPPGSPLTPQISDMAAAIRRPAPPPPAGAVLPPGGAVPVSVPPPEDAGVQRPFGEAPRFRTGRCHANAPFRHRRQRPRRRRQGPVA